MKPPTESYRSQIAKLTLSHEYISHRRILRAAPNQVEANSAALVANFRCEIKSLQRQLRDQSEMMERLRCQALLQARSPN